MILRFFAAVAFSCALAAPPLAAKAKTVKIIVSAEGSPQVEIASRTVAQFHVWDGAGVFINGEPQLDGFIAQWRKGPVVERPSGLKRHKISFYSGCLKGEDSCDNPGAQLSYVVSYEFDPASGKGFVYIPRTDEPGYVVTGHTISRPGYEGKWYEATVEWRDFIRPSLQIARN